MRKCADCDGGGISRKICFPWCSLLFCLSKLPWSLLIWLEELIVKVSSLKKFSLKQNIVCSLVYVRKLRPSIFFNILDDCLDYTSWEYAIIFCCCSWLGVFRLYLLPDSVCLVWGLYISKSFLNFYIFYLFHACNFFYISYMNISWYITVFLLF